MPSDTPFRLRTLYVATRGVQEYRATIPTHVRQDDVVLEIGCEWGTATALIARHCHAVVGTDVSSICVERARRLHPDLEFAVLDAHDLPAAIALGRAFSLIYVDISGISGYRSLLDAIALVTMYATVFNPRAIVVKSGALKHFAAYCHPWRPPRAESDPIPFSQPRPVEAQS